MMSKKGLIHAFFLFKKHPNVFDLQIEVRDVQSKKEGAKEELSFLSALYAKGTVHPNLILYPFPTHHTVEALVIFEY